tara:strand:+ start:80 stop:1012 length:933 start_codon:yes stop_codon:yes gene_type:complete
MKINFIAIFILGSFLVSCSNETNPNNSDLKTHKDNVQGFWNRIGTIQLVNGIAVDTLLIKNSENPDFKQIKAFKDDNTIWINNYKDSLSPWKGGSGGYGKFKIHSKDSITEMISHGTGFWGAMVKNYKDSLNTQNWKFGLTTDFNKNRYTQKNSPDSQFMEYWEKLPPLEPKSRIDGAWKRVYEIAYINGIPVDTISVSSDIILDVKIISNGRYTYQVDLTGNSEENTPQYGGFGGFGTCKFDGENNTFTEWGEWGSGQWTGTSEPKTDPDVHQLTIYNDDLFLQVSKSSVGVLANKGATGRGVVYKRIK